ncbi:sigma factor [Streptomyces lydicus]|uniref:sigma factor n=1 Tax=Streptomyces lydicus TaxID=47763 RepID=UPI0036E72991
MTETLTMDLIKDAQNNGLEGISAVLEAMSGRISGLANAAADRIKQSAGNGVDAAREDFTQEANLALFEALPRFAGETVDSFYAFMYTTMDTRLRDVVRSERNSGADSDAIKVFGQMLLKADGDVHLAEKYAQTVPPKGKRLSADRAQAARLAWVGTHSLDAALDFGSIANTNSAIAGDYRPAEYTRAGSLASSLGVPDDLIEAGDLNSEERRVKHAIVHGILDVMGAGQRAVIECSFGIRDAVCFGHGDGCDNEGMAAHLGMEVKNLRPARTRGMQSFAKRYIKAVAKSEAEAQELTEAAAANMSHGGRK